MAQAMRFHAWQAIVSACLIALLALPFAASHARAEAGVFEPLTVITKTGRHDFQVEVMRTDAELERGMMFRRSLAPDRGMLFQFAAEAPQTFWMENTFISLDMVFIKADGTVHRVEANAEPLSTATISSGAPVLAVLEISGGEAAKLDIEPGDRVLHAMFPKR